MINKKLKKKNNNNNLLFNSLLKSKNFYGKTLNKTNKNILPFIYGKRFNYNIINLKYVSYFLKRSLKLIEKTLKENKKILIIGNSSDIKFLVNKNFTKNNKNIIFFNQNWIYGLITNHSMNFYLKKNNIQLILIIKNSINENFLKRELLNLKVPVISFMDTNQNLEGINYPILTNLKNIKSVYNLMFFFRKLF
jgi:ribosomal protein S2